MNIDDDRLFDAVRAGASAFLSKDIEAQHLLDAIARVANGEQLINQTILQRPQLAWKVLSEFRNLADRGDGSNIPKPAESAIPLSVREIEVLDCVAQGLSNREIAGALYITEQTVKNHMTSVLRKLQVDDRVAALRYAVQKGWAEIGPQTYAAVERAVAGSTSSHGSGQ